ncbi:MAG: hypothetical protein RRB22_01110 [Gammaproteobacteria bacterium]|nr:hypothetical protein [Gammaproteobacteria bacterium]
MKKLYLALLLAFPLIAHAGWDGAISEIKSEPKVKDVLHKGGILYVGVISDGKNRDGYASYICEILRDHAIKGSIDIYITDIVKVTRDNDWAKLGKHYCRL